MKLSYPVAFVAIAGSMALTGCFYDKYDLSDIDTNVAVNVDNLVIPINIDQIEMSSIIDPKDPIEVIDGAYTYVKSGKFSSSSVNIDEFVIKPADNLAPSTAVLRPSVPVAVAIPIEYNVNQSYATNIDLSADNIPSEIKEVYGVGANTTLTTRISFGSLKQIVNKLDLTDLVLQLPAGLIVESTNEGTFDAATSTFSVKNVTVQATDAAFEYVLKLNVTGVSFTDNQIVDGKISYHSQAALLSGCISIKSDYYINFVTPMPEEISLSVGFELPKKINVDYIDGTIEYAIDNLNIPDVDITGLPDVLTGNGTNLILDNPRLYLSLTDPLYDMGLYAETGMQIESIKDGNRVGVYTMDEPLVIGREAGHYDGNIFNFYLSPDALPASQVDADYPKAAHVTYSTLGQVLSGDGMPSKLKVSATQPRIPTQRVKKFKLGTNYGKVEGNYKFVAPLQLKAGSEVVYDDRIDGWSSDDLDKVTITRLELTLKVTTNIPVGVDFTGYPLGTNGKRLPGVVIEGAKINPMANGQEVKIVVNGEIRHLDGIEFVARAKAVDGSPLSPGMTIKLENIRPVVSGYYEKEL